MFDWFTLFSPLLFQYFLSHLQRAKKTKEGEAPRTVPKEVLFEEFENRHPKLDFDPQVPDEVTDFNEVLNIINNNMLNNTDNLVLYLSTSLLSLTFSFVTRPNRYSWGRCKISTKPNNILCWMGLSAITWISCRYTNALQEKEQENNIQKEHIYRKCNINNEIQKTKAY